MTLAAFAILCLLPISVFGQSDPFSDDNSEEIATEPSGMFKVFSDPAGREYFTKGKASYYTRYLSAMKEPSVKEPLQEGVERVFRFTYLRSFDDPLVVRFVDKGGGMTATAIRLKLDDQYRPVKVVHDQSWALSKESSKTVREMLAQNVFWKPLNGLEQALAESGTDGSRWIFECHDKNGYRMMDVWSPEILAGLEMESKGAVPDASSVRDFLIYKKAGNQILKIGKVLPLLKKRY